jgi:hypothetical protein
MSAVDEAMEQIAPKKREHLSPPEKMSLGGKLDGDEIPKVNQRGRHDAGGHGRSNGSRAEAGEVMDN